MLGTLSHVGIYDLPPNVTGARCFGHFRDALDITWSESVDNNETCRVVLPPTSPALAVVGNRRILALHFNAATPGGTGTRRVFRIWNVREEKTAQGFRTIIDARSLTYDFADAGPVAFQYAGGFQSFQISGTLTWAQWWDTYLQPHLTRLGYAFYGRTAFNTIYPVRITADRWTATQFMDEARSQTDWEWQLIEYGAQFLVDVQAQRINGALSPIVVRTESNALQLARARSSNEQATVLVPIGGGGHSDSARTIQHYQPTEVAGRNYANKTVPFLAFSLDGVSLTGLYLMRIKTGRCFLIVGQAGSVLTLNALTNAGAGDTTWEFREALTPTTRIDFATPGFPLRVNGTPSGSAVVIDNPFSAADPSPTDDVHIDCRLTPSALVLATTASNVAAVAGSSTDIDITFASLTGVAVGDWGFLANSASTPWGLFSKVYTVVQLVSSTVARVRCRYSFDSGTPTPAGVISKQAQFYRARALVPYVDDEVASTNTLTVSSIAGIASADLLEYGQDNSGAMLTGLPSALSAAPPTGFGICRREKEFAEHRCVFNLMGALDPWFESFTGSVPFYWTLVAGVSSHLTSGLPGPSATDAVHLNSNSILRLTDPFYVRPTSGDSKVSVRVQLKTPTVATWTGAVDVKISVTMSAGTIISTLTLVPPDYPSPPAGAQSVDPDTIVTADLLAVDLFVPVSSGQYPPTTGIKIELRTDGAGADFGGVLVVQDSTLPPNGEMIKVSDSEIWTLGQVALGQFERPLEANSFDALAVQQLLQGSSSAEFIKGRTVRLKDPDLGDFEDRIMVLDYQADQEGTVKVQVRTHVDDIAQLLARQLLANR